MPAALTRLDAALPHLERGIDRAEQQLLAHTDSCPTCRTLGTCPTTEAYKARYVLAVRIATRWRERLLPELE